MLSHFPAEGLVPGSPPRGKVFLGAPCYPFLLSSPHPPSNSTCLDPLPITPLPVPGLSVGWGAGLQSHGCDLDFKAETVPGADSPRALFLAQPGRATAGPFCLLAPGCASERAWECLLLVGVLLALLPSSLCVCHGACHQGRLVCSGPSRGWEWGLLGPRLL